MKRRTFLAGAGSVLAASLQTKAADRKSWEWREYASDAHSSRYAPLDQITKNNVAHLEPVWELETLPPRVREQGTIQCTPIVVDGIMYVSAHGLYSHAIEAHTGKLIWSNKGFDDGERRRQAAGTSRGVTYWKDGSEERIFAPVREHIFAINAKTGKLVDSFGTGGAIELEKGLDRDVDAGESIVSRTPPAVYGDLLIVMSVPGEGPEKSPPGHIRAYDCRTGKRRWIFHTIPHPGEFGYETWSKDSWKTCGGANCWGGVSIDHERGLIFVATGSPAFDFWGGDRIGENLFGNCVLCLKAETGERVWHYQTVHHDLFDYDLPCAPNLVTVQHGGRAVDAVAQVTKMGWVVLLNRETGKPLYPIEERPVAKSTVPGEQAWPTQPVVTKPPPFSRLSFTKDDLAHLSKESHDYLVNERMKDVVFAPMFTPPALDQEVLVFPGYHGGGLWGGGSWVAEKGVLFVNHNEIPWSLRLVKAPEGSYRPYEHTGYLRPLDKEGYPAVKPPWGQLSAIDLNACKILWQVPLGEYDELTKRGIPPTGTYNRGGNIATKSGLLFSAAAEDGRLRAFDQENGEILWTYQMGGIGLATPSTFEVDGRQFVIAASSPDSAVKGKGPKAGFTAFALPA